MTIPAGPRAALAGAAIVALTSGHVANAATDPSQIAAVLHESGAVVIEQPAPEFPRRIRRSQEGWVQMSYVITPNGQAIDPIIIDSSGGIGFENEVRKVSETWRFGTADVAGELPYNIANFRFTVLGQGRGSTKKFARYAKHIMKNLHAEKVASARGVVDEALHTDGWTLYESTLLYLMAGRVAGAEGDDARKLEMYRRGLAVSDELSLRPDARRDLLEEIFELELRFGQYGAALRTFNTLKDLRGSADAVARLSTRVDEVEAILRRDENVVANATIVNPCNCEDGVPLWHYAPVRRTFSFANVSGNVDRFEARCERRRISDNVVPARTWTLDEDWGFCRIFVFGDDQARFDFLEHLPDNGQNSDAAGKTTVARNYVLDQRN